jgi:hypothetical protein
MSCCVLRLPDGRGNANDFAGDDDACQQTLEGFVPDAAGRSIDQMLIRNTLG